MNKTTPKRIAVYYVSGHGYGHFTRSSNVMQALLEKKVVDTIVVRTKVSEIVFKETLPHEFYCCPHARNLTLKRDSSGSSVITNTTTNNNKTATVSASAIVRSEPPHDLDAGTVQTSPLNLDPAQTLENHAQLFTMKSMNRLLETELLFIHRLTAANNESLKLILSDASPLGLKVAATMGVPGVLVSNFDWSAIMDSFVKDLRMQQSSVLHTATVTVTRKDDHHIQKLKTTAAESSSVITMPISEFLKECAPSLQLAKSMYASATAIIRPMAAVPSPVSYSQTFDTPWLCPKILRSATCSSGSGDLFSSCRQKLKDAMFGIDHDDKQQQKGMNGVDSALTAIEHRICLVTFGGQPGNVGSRFFSNNDISKVDINSSSNAALSVGAGTTPLKKIMLGFVFATSDADEQVKQQHKYDNNYRSNMGYACNNITPAYMAMTASQARKVAFGAEESGSVAELTKICDVVLCKPGYGTICETVASCGGTTMVYVNREPEFAEEQYLVQNLGKGAVKLTRDLFERRDWYGAISEALRPEAFDAMRQLIVTGSAQKQPNHVAVISPYDDDDDALAGADRIVEILENLCI